MCVTGRPGEPELLHRLDADHVRELDVADEGFVDVGERHVGVVQREQAGVAGEMQDRPILEHAERHHADAGDGDALELQSAPHAGTAPDATGRNR